MIVVDTSVAIKWVVDEERREQARLVLLSGLDLVAPDLLMLEAANTLRRKVRQAEIDVEQMRQGLALIGQSVRLIPIGDVIEEATGLAIELDHPPYDCCFLACAREYGLLVSDDEAFLRKCRATRFGDRVVSLGEDDLDMALQRSFPLHQR